MAKHSKKKQLKNALKSQKRASQQASAMAAGASHSHNKHGTQTLSLTNFLLGPASAKLGGGFVEPNTAVEQTISLKDIPTAQELLAQNNLIRRQKKLFVLSNKQLFHIFYAPKLLVREEVISDSLSHMKGFNEFHDYTERVYLSQNYSKPEETDVLVLSYKKGKDGYANQSFDAKLTLYPNGKVEDAVSLFRFDGAPGLKHSSTRFVNGNPIKLNFVTGAHFHTMTEEEELNHEISLSHDPATMPPGFDPSSVYGKWFAFKLEKACGKTIETLEDFLEVCKNDFGFTDVKTNIDQTIPLKDLPLKAFWNSIKTSKQDTFQIVGDEKTMKFIETIQYESPIDGSAPANQKPKHIYLDNTKQPKHNTKLELEGATF